MILGITMITIAASCTVQLVEYWPLNRVKLTGSVSLFGSDMKISANISSFHIETKLKIDIVAIADFDRGNIIFQNIFDMFPPSIMTASSISFGIVRMNPDNMKMEVGRAKATYGRIKAR